MISSKIYVLYMGRLFGGLATTLLYSVFDAWTISAHRKLQLATDEMSLKETFRNMTLVNSIVAICSGVMSDLLVKRGGSCLLPFAAGQVSCLAAFVSIWLLWDENCGISSSYSSSTPSMSQVCHSSAKVKLVVLSLAICFFEGAMYLFVFFWSAALTSAAQQHDPEAQPPFGLIFASFMSFMMSGSIICSLFLRVRTKEAACTALVSAMLGASMCLSSAALAPTEYMLYWAFCSIEVCIGAYFLAIGHLKSQYISDISRGHMNSLLRAPLNVLVILAHCLDKEGSLRSIHP